MIARSAAWIADVTGGVLVAPEDVTVTSVAHDSRHVNPGALYVALPGERADGHDFVAAATDAGAVLHLVTRTVEHPHVRVADTTAALGAIARAYLAELRSTSEIHVVGITGSNGKTTTKDLLAAAIPDVVAPVESFNNEVGLPLTVLRADENTRTLVLEMGASGPGQITYLTSIAPLDVACVLMVGSAHRGMYESFEAIAAAKKEIVEGLLPTGVAVLNSDDAHVMAMAESAPRVVTFGRGQADVAATHVEMRQGHARITVSNGPVGMLAAQCIPQQATLGLLGEHHVTNALAAIAVAVECGVRFEEAVRDVAGVTSVSGQRMALTHRRDGIVVLDDSYNASVESVIAAFRSLKDVAEGARTIAVLGEILEMGEESVSAHAQLGREAVRLDISTLVVVGEGAKPAYDSALLEGSWGEEARYVATIDEADTLLREILGSGDTVLFKASHGTGVWKLAQTWTEDG